MKLLLAIACALLFWGQAASAALVIVMRPASPSAQATETLTFLHGELSSVALDDEVIERPAAGTPAAVDFRVWLEQLAAERGAFAVIEIVGNDGVSVIDVWVRKSPGRFEVTRVGVDPDTSNAPARLAIRAVEALRASLAEADFAARYLRSERASKPTPTPMPVRDERQEPPNINERVGLELGGSLLVSPGGVAPAALPLVRIDWALRSFLLAQVALSGLGRRSALTTAAGKALIAREYALLGACYRLRPNQPWWPLFSLAVGALHTSVEGQAGFGMDAHAVDQWSLLAEAGFGVAVRLYRSYQLTSSGHVQVAQPSVAIHFGEPVTATVGRPNLLLTLAVGAWL